jgi:hypothetical protein
MELPPIFLKHPFPPLEDFVKDLVVVIVINDGLAAHNIHAIRDECRDNVIGAVPMDSFGGVMGLNVRIADLAHLMDVNGDSLDGALEETHVSLLTLLEMSESTHLRDE